MVMICSKCQKAFEPPFDSAEFQCWLDAIIGIYECTGVASDWLCLECAGVEILKDIPKCISIVA